jgi:hypothetical protein
MKQEPSLGNLFGLFNTTSTVIDNNHEDLVSDALDSFAKAEAKMEVAIEKINEQIAGHAQAAIDAQNRMSAAKDSGDRLRRVLTRIQTLTA